MASFTIAQVALKAADIGLETSDSLLKWTGNEKVKHDVLVLSDSFITLERQVDPILMCFRKVRSGATSLRKEGVNLNGTEKVMIILRVFFKCVYLVYSCPLPKWCYS